MICWCKWKYCCYKALELVPEDLINKYKRTIWDIRILLLVLEAEPKERFFRKLWFFMLPDLALFFFSSHPFQPICPTSYFPLFFSTSFFFFFCPRNNLDQTWDLLATLNPSVFRWNLSPFVWFSSSTVGKNIFFQWVAVERVAEAHLASRWRAAENPGVLAKLWMTWMIRLYTLLKINKPPTKKSTRWFKQKI